MSMCKTCEGLGYIVFQGTQFANAKKCTCRLHCSLCHDSGFQKVNQNGYVFYKKCDCVHLDKRIMLFNRAKIPLKFFNKSLENYEHLGGNQGYIRNKLLLFRQEFPFSRRGFILSGAPGVGKTHLLVSIIKYLTLELGSSCVFVDFFQLLQDIRNSYQRGEGQEQIFDQITHNEVIAIDELGKGRGSEWEINILDDLITKIYNGNKVLLITTNFSPTEDPGGSFHGGTETLEERVGKRIFSRIAELCTFYVIEGPDYRKV